MRQLLTAILFFFFSTVSAQFQGLIVNEFSQGDQGSREYIELLVAGKRTCSDSTADLRGWIVDDQNGWYGTASLTAGHYRFKDVFNWSAVPIGAIILLYNSAANNKNNSITLADDATDANKDFIYIVPINSSAYIEEYDTEPSGGTGAAYIYPPATSTIGYTGTSNLWITHIALNNGSDVICTVSPQDRTTHYFSIGYGYPIVSGFRNPSVSVPAVNAGNSCYLTDSNYTITGSWTIASVPTNETPGFPNGGTNTTWIQAMRTTPKPLAAYTTACSNGPYIFFGQTIVTSGPYTMLSNNANGCVDTNRLYVVIKKTEVIDTAGCDSLIYKGITYATNTTLVEKFGSTVINCDSLVRTVNITIKKSSSSFTKACVGIGQSYVFNGTAYSTSGNYVAALINSNGCDSTAKLFLVVTDLQTAAISGCGSVMYNGTTHVSSTIISDTIKSIVAGCDSLIMKTIIQVNPVKTTYVTACANDGDIYNFNGQFLTSSGLYSARLTAINGCDSIVNLYLVFKKRIIQNIAGCDSVVINNIPYYQSGLQSDTVKSIISGCDSLIRIKNIIINHSKTTAIVACSSTGSYNFFGQVVTTGGNYTHTLTTSTGCDSIIKLYLVITNFQNLTLSGCNSVTYNGSTYLSSTIVSDTIASLITGCDSIVRKVQIIISSVIYTNTTACIGAGQIYNFNGQLLTATGSYSTTYSANNCDSIVRLYLVVSRQQVRTLPGCDSVLFNGVFYTSSTTLRDTVRSVVSFCDSIYQITNIIILPKPIRFITACIQQGQAYNFNGLVLSSTGSYQTVFSTTLCDSIVHLYLVVAKLQILTYRSCSQVVYNGITYTSSVILKDTVKSAISNCDSLYHVVQIMIQPISDNYINACIAEGSSFNFNGQVLTATGYYTTTYTLTAGCDSIVHLNLIVRKTQSQTISGCSFVSYNGASYTSSIIISDTVRSVVTGCDSIIYLTIIQVNQKPIMQVNGNTTICKGDSIQLKASSATATINWPGYGTNDSITVRPVVTTNYTAIATDTNGCTNSIDVTVYVQDFSLVVFAIPSSVLSGQPVFLQTVSLLPYTITSWQPSALFQNGMLKTQRLIADSSLQIMVTGKTASGCKDTAYVFIPVIPFDDVYIPSGFTPNGDGRNETVKVFGTGIKEIDFKIFNRWGQLVFHSNDKNKGWDGKLANVLQPAGTYVYVVMGKKINRQIVEKKGTVTLIR